MAYSLELLAGFKEVPNFEENVIARKLTDHYYANGCGGCRYPIVPLGNYVIDQSKAKKIQSRSIKLIYLGNLLAVYGLARSSRLATVLGAISFAFTARKIGQAIIGLLICPAAISGLHRRFPKMIPNLFRNYLVERQQAHAMITGLYDSNCVSEYTVTNIKITKSETTYDTYFIVWPEKTKKIRGWIIHALDGAKPPGMCLSDYPWDYYLMMDQERAFNHVIISGPSVGHSTGWPNNTNIGVGYSAAIHLLEQIGATHIVMEARGLFGGLTLAKAVEIHDFASGKKRKICYLAISISTAHGVGEAVKQTKLGRVAESMANICGMNITSDKMNLKLWEMEIEHIVIGHNDPNSPFDGFVHDKASLYNKLKDKNFSNVRIISETAKQSDDCPYYWEQVKNNQVVKQKLEKFLEQ